MGSGMCMGRGMCMCRGMFMGRGMCMDSDTLCVVSVRGGCDLILIIHHLLHQSEGGATCGW